MVERQEPTAERGLDDDLELPPAFEPIVLESADDARAEAVRRARAGAPEGTLVWVRSPTSPHARLDRPWLPAPGGGLHAALVVRPMLPAGECAELAVATALALARALADVVEPATELHYRWPNDLLLDSGKAAGIWLEGGGTADSLEWLVIAWSVNTAEPPEELGFDAAGVAREGRSGEAQPEALLEAIARHLLAWIERWDDGEFEPLRASWRGRLKLGETIRLTLADGSVIDGIGEDIDEEGALTLRTDTGPRRIALNEFFALPTETA
jgi:BirA family biotin operon repressor/biotin-[acetyl-CoA-carboxylase] ligase